MDTQLTPQSDSLRTSDLQPGDVLLHMGTGELSKLIAWVGDSAYSHAAMVIGGNQLIEAAASGVRHAGLAERTRMLANFHYIDAYRPLRPTAQDVRGRDALLAAAEVYLGRPYPMTSLLTLGVICAVRNKTPGGVAMQQVLRMALDLVVHNDASQVVCSELVYRAFDEAATTPAHALRLPLTTQWVAPTPMPKIDVGTLLAECLDDYQRSRPKAPAMTLSATEGTDPAQLAELLAQARASLDLDGAVMSGAGDHAPNPKTVLPADLQFSPGLHKLGRLAMTA
jgi:hypothetical protein